jgi:hypothetical protein
MKYFDFEIGIKVRVAECYLTDECTQHVDTTEIAYVCSEPSDSEELVGIQYESGVIDYVPQDILTILGDERYHHCDDLSCNCMS